MARIRTSTITTTPQLALARCMALRHAVSATTATTTRVPLTTGGLSLALTLIGAFTARLRRCIPLRTAARTRPDATTAVPTQEGRTSIG